MCSDHHEAKPEIQNCSSFFPVAEDKLGFKAFLAFSDTKLTTE